MLKVGDKVTRWPKTIESMIGRGGSAWGTALELKPLRGVVVYIHPKNRFHVVEFENARGEKLRETFEGVS